MQNIPPYSIFQVYSAHKFLIDKFDCGDQNINDFLKNDLEYSKDNFFKAFLMVHESDGETVIGFYTLSNSIIPRKEIPDKYKRKCPYDWPCILIGQFAIDKKYQGYKLSKQLLGNAYARIAKIHLDSDSALRAIRVDTRNEKAVDFWKYNKFTAFQKRQTSLFLEIEILLQILKGS